MPEQEVSKVVGMALGSRTGEEDSEEAQEGWKMSRMHEEEQKEKSVIWVCEECGHTSEADSNFVAVGDEGCCDECGGPAYAVEGEDD